MRDLGKPLRCLWLLCLIAQWSDITSILHGAIFRCFFRIQQKNAPAAKPIRWIHTLEFQAPLRKMLFQPTISSVKLSHHPKVLQVRYMLTPSNSFIRSQSPPNHSPSPALSWYCPRSPWLPRCLAPPYLPHPRCRHRCAKRHGLNSANTDQVVTWLFKKKWGENRGRNVFTLLLPEKKREIFFNSPMFSSFFVSMNLPQPKKAASGIDLSAFEAQIQQLEVQGVGCWLQAEVVWCSETTRFWWISAHQFAMVVDVCNPDWDVHHDIIASVSLKLYKCAAGVLDFLFVFCFVF